MHDIRLHVRSAPTNDERDTFLVSTWLEIDGEHVVEKSSDNPQPYSLVGKAPTGFLYLELFRPSDDLRARLTDGNEISEISSYDGTTRPDPDVLWIHVRSVEVVHH